MVDACIANGSYRNDNRVHDAVTFFSFCSRGLGIEQQDGLFLGHACEIKQVGIGDGGGGAVGVLLGAGAWALAALFVPYLARARTVIADAVRVTLWSAATVAAMVVAVTVIKAGGASALPSAQRLPTTSAEIVGAAAGAVLLLLWSVVRFRLPTSRRSSTGR